MAEIFNSVENTSQKTTLEIAEQKFERRLTQLDSKIGKVYSQLDSKIDRVASQLDSKIDRVASQLDSKIDRVASETKAELIKWMFVFWVGQTLTTFGMFQFFLSRHQVL